MRIITFESAIEKMIGLQYRPSIENETLFVFPAVDGGDEFHSQHVPEPFDIAFVSAAGEVLAVYRMVPPFDRVAAPPGTAYAVEAKAGSLGSWGFAQGALVSL